MTTNGRAAIQSLELPPGHPGISYVVPSLCGEIIYIPCSKSAMRLLVTGKETDNAFALVGTGGTTGDPIGFHFHREAHDVFLCLKGEVNVWANDQCRTLTAGDLASVPPVSSAHWEPICHGYLVLMYLPQGCRSPISNRGQLHRIRRPDRPRRLGRIFPVHRRTLRRSSLPRERQPECL